MLLLPFLLSLSFAAQYPQDVELDLVFPRNDTYTPLKYFPIVLGLQNAQAAWPQHFGIKWTLWRIHDSDELEEMQSASFPKPPLWPDDGTFPFEPESLPGNGFTDGEAPVDPFFYFYFPGHIMGSTVGHWMLTWRSGFAQNCSSSLEPPQVPFYDEPLKEVIFRTAPGGSPVNLISFQAQCPGFPQTFRIEDALVDFGHVCPVLNDTNPKADPCVLRVPESLWTNITLAADMRADCALADLTQCSLGAEWPLWEPGDGDG
ncbi:hypothetical protein BJX61DRAFT_539186 [Aspergillus egyptiacus]|nr:hypothetical protein BJX61DRAFT_539186 [Aspergillus egyptiacus]